MTDMIRNKLCISCLVALLLVGLMFTGCAKKEITYERAYRLAEMQSGEETLELTAYCPEGGALLLSNEGMGILQLGSESCTFSWEAAGDDFNAQINALQAEGELLRDAARLTFPELSLTYIFTADGAPLPREESIPVELPEPNTLQQRWNGRWIGRIWFSNASGEWAEYETRTMAALAEIRLDGNGEGTLTLWNDFYSSDYPMGAFSLRASGEEAEAGEGMLMSYPLAERSVSVQRMLQEPGEIENTIIMHPDVWEYGHYYESEAEEEAPATLVDVLRLTGGVKEADGGFDFKIVLTREEE